MGDVDRFFQLVADELAAVLAEADPASVELRHWILVDDTEGVAITEVGEDAVPHEALAGLCDRGASGAAYVTYNPKAEVVVAQVLVTEPRNFDIRRARTRRAADGVSLDEWEYTV
jgi:hypothetical protein